MNEQIKAKVKMLTTLYVDAMGLLLDSEEDTQLLILIYSDEETMNAGFGCKRCATEAAVKFAELNVYTKHTGKAVVN